MSSLRSVAVESSGVTNPKPAAALRKRPTSSFDLALRPVESASGFLWLSLRVHRGSEDHVFRAELKLSFLDQSLDATFYFTFFINELKFLCDRFRLERLVVFLLDEVQDALFDIQICFHTNSVGPDWNLRNADSLKEPKEAKEPRLLASECQMMEF